MADLALQRLALKAILSLPRPILRTLAGGGVVHRGGRTLDPHFQLMAAQARGQPPMSSVTAVEARLASRAGFAIASGKPEPGVRWEPQVLDGPDGPVPTRVYRPDNQDPTAPALVWLHMGGGVIGDLETCHAFCTILASTVRCPVVSVDYRLAPEHRYPAGLDDCMFAYRHVRDHAAEFGAPEGQAAIGGDSMGGYFSAIIAQDLKLAGEPQPSYALLVYPCVDVASETPSMTLHADTWPLTRDTMNWFMGQYLSADADPASPRLSPIRATDLSGLAPTLLVTAGFDPLSDQGEAYARRLIAAGVPTVFRCQDSLPHGFTGFGALPAADRACREIAALTRRAATGELFGAG
jgi:acetyl esterase/lipase